MRRISSFRSPAALSMRAAFKEFEQMSSANPALLCAGENFCGFISKRRTEYPACAICHAASEPARPAPMTVTVCLFSIFLPRVVLIERVSAARRYAVERLGFVFFL